MCACVRACMCGMFDLTLHFLHVLVKHGGSAIFAPDFYTLCLTIPYVCMYVCTYVGMYICTYVRRYVGMYICTYVGMYICTYVCRYVGM